MSVTDADRVMARGAYIPLGKGQKLPIKFGYRQLYELEKRFGSVQNVFEVFAAGMSGAFFETFLGTLSIGTGVDEEELMDQLDPSDIEKHSNILAEALTQAFPQQAQAAKEATTQESPGPSTITSLPSGSVEAKKSSKQ